MTDCRPTFTKMKDHEVNVLLFPAVCSHYCLKYNCISVLSNLSLNTTCGNINPAIFSSVLGSQSCCVQSNYSKYGSFYIFMG